jgi:hypothetical protein
LGTREVQYAVAPPDDAKEELATMVYFATTSPMGTFSITSRIGCSIYAAIAERFILGCNIKDVWVAANTKKGPGGETIYEGITFTIEAENTGNVHLRPTGNIVITAGDGTKYDVLIMRGFPAYPGHGEKYTARWNKADIPAGTYEAEINLDYGNIYSVEKIVKAKKTFVVKNEDGVL